MTLPPCCTGHFNIKNIISIRLTNYDCFQIHNWDGKIQGTILSSFFFGYAVMLLPSELFLGKIGGKILTTAILVINGAICVAMPTIVNKVFQYNFLFTYF